MFQLAQQTHVFFSGEIVKFFMGVRVECLLKTTAEKLLCNGNTFCCVYDLPDTRPSFDKGNHKERSLMAQPNHRKFWKKQERESTVVIYKK